MVSSHVYQFHNQSKQSTKASTKQRIKQTDRTGPDHPLSPAVSLCELACCLTDSRPGRCIRRRANKEKKIAAAHDLRVEPALFGLLCVPPAAGFTSSESERSQERGGSSMALHPRSSAFFIQATKQRFQPHAAALPAYPIDAAPGPSFWIDRLYAAPATARLPFFRIGARRRAARAGRAGTPGSFDLAQARRTARGHILGQESHGRLSMGERPALLWGRGRQNVSSVTNNNNKREIINSQKLRKAPPRGLCQWGLRADPRTTHITVDLRTIRDRGPLLLPLFSWVEHPTL